MLIEYRQRSETVLARLLEFTWILCETFKRTVRTSLALIYNSQANWKKISYCVKQPNQSRQTIYRHNCVLNMHLQEYKFIQYYKHARNERVSATKQPCYYASRVLSNQSKLWDPNAHIPDSAPAVTSLCACPLWRCDGNVARISSRVRRNASYSELNQRDIIVCWERFFFRATIYIALHRCNTLASQQPVAGGLL